MPFWQDAVLLLPLVLVVICNLAGRHLWAEVMGLLGMGALIGLLALLGVTELASGILPLAPTAGPAAQHGLAVGGGVLAATALLCTPLLLPPVRRALAHFIPIDPDSQVHALALVMTLALAGLQLSNQLATDVLGDTAARGPVLTPLDLILQEIPFLLAALLGVGLFTRRGLAAAADRLGWVWPAWWQLALGLAAAGAFYAFSVGMEALAHQLTPGLSHRVDAANQRLFGGLDNPVGIATLALAAGIAEEALFRGALQPRLGIIWTSLVFASVHTQYGLTLDALTVFILACGLGLVRRFVNTTTSTVCHVAYNGLVGVGVGSALLGPGLSVEAVLLAAAAVPLVGRLRRRRAGPRSPAS